MDRTRIRKAATFLAASGLLLLSGCSNPLGLVDSGRVEGLEQFQEETRRVYTNPNGPAQDDEAEDIVTGFMNAMPAGVQNDGFTVARQFLTAEASQQWDPDEGTVVFSDSPEIIRKADVLGERRDEKEITMQLRLKTTGALDGHGVYTPAQSGSEVKLEIMMEKVDGQWRISRAPNGVQIALSDFEQVFRQVSLFQLASSRTTLIPDIRWFAWRSWRALAVKELLDGPAGWLVPAAVSINELGVELLDDSLLDNATDVEVHLSSSLDLMTPEDREMLIHQIRLTLGDGSPPDDIRIYSGSGADYSGDGSESGLMVTQVSKRVYSYSAGAVVSLSSADLLRVGESSPGKGASGLVFTEGGGALLKEDGSVECLSASVRSCGTMFAGRVVHRIAAGQDGEIWAVTRGGDKLLVHHGQKEYELSISWLGSSRIEAVAVSDEGSRMALILLDEAGKSRVVLTGIERDESLRPLALAERSTLVAARPGVSALVFYNDTTLVYALADGEGYQQLVPGPESTQNLPDHTVALASGKIDEAQSLVALDSSGIVRNTVGSLKGIWMFKDSQVEALASGD